MTTPVQLVPFLKLDAKPILEVFVEERYLVPDATGKIFTCRESNWLNTPPAIIRVSGIRQTAGYSINYTSGTVVFTVAPAATAVVTAEFWFQPYSDTELSNFCTVATSEFAGLLGELIDRETDLPALYEAPILDIAFRRLYTALWARTSDYHKFEIDGAMVDKSVIAKAYAEVVKQRNTQIMEIVKRIRLANLVSGTFATTAAIAGGGAATEV